MKIAKEQLKELYEEKVRNGLINVKFTFTDSAKNATADELYQEVLKMEDAINKGAYEIFRFGDSHRIDLR